MKARILLCFFAALAIASQSRAAPVSGVAPEKPVVLVSSDRVVDSIGESVVLVVPLGNGSHFGFVLNQPTETPLAEIFPDEEASSRVQAHVYVGGPVMPSGVFAVVRDAIPGREGLHRITPELSIALKSDDVDAVIARRPADARFFVGMMLWMPGELAEEMAAGAWQTSAAHADVVMSRNPASLWPRLSQRGGYRAVSGKAAGDAAPAVHTERAAPVPKPDPRQFPLGFRLRHG